MQEKIVIHWFRRDLRLHDNRSLFEALNSGMKVLPIFIFDKNILSPLPKRDKRVCLIYDTLDKLNNELFEKHQSGIETFYDYPENVFEYLIQHYPVYAIYTNKDYEPYAIQRDEKIRSWAEKNGIYFRSFKDHVLFEENEIMKPSGEPFLVYTHYAKSWKKRFFEQFNGLVPHYPSEKYLHNLIEFKEKKQLIPLEKMNFEREHYSLPTLNLDSQTLLHYHDTRDKIYLENGTTHASVYLRFGMVSTRELIQKGVEYSPRFLDELIWREFYQMILYHFPESVNSNFKKNYHVKWENNERWFELWKNGQTGFPIVDAAMNELNTTGYMHNRCRMIVANFLTKILLIDWRWGERYFAEKLMDYEMASNVGNWQWSAGTGVDAAPYFRIFNPYLQQEKFDPEYEYVKRWIKDFQFNKYIPPIVDYDGRRKRALEHPAISKF